MGNSNSTEAAGPEVEEEGDEPLSIFLRGQHLEKKNQHVTTTDSDADDLCGEATRIAQQQENQEKHEPSWESSVSGGIARSFAYSLRTVGFGMKGLGLSGKAVQRMMTKQAFLQIGKRSHLHSTSAPPLADPYRDAWRQSHGSVHAKLSWPAKLSEFTKSSVLGITVFGLYEYLILQRMHETQDEATDKHQPLVLVYRYNHNDDTNQQQQVHHHSHHVLAQVSVHPPDSTAHTLLPLQYHIFAGASAGASQSIVLDGWEISSYWIHRQRYRHLHDGHAPDMYSLVNTNLVLRRLIHHSLGYMTLFGTYECVRRQGHAQVQAALQSGQPWVTDHLDWLLERGWIGTRKTRNVTTTNDHMQHGHEMYDLTALPLLISFGAGGVAGQAHFLASHYLRQLRKWNDHSHHVVRHATLRSTCIAFLPTALGFMAFQYGGELTERFLILED